jgi:hypothetical protein
VLLQVLAAWSRAVACDPSLCHVQCVWLLCLARLLAATVCSLVDVFANAYHWADVLWYAALLPQVLAAGSSKVACDYSNRLCQWNATYAFGGAVLGDLVSALVEQLNGMCFSGACGGSTRK